MNIEIVNQNTKMLVDFHRHTLPSGPPPVELLHAHSYAEIHIIHQGTLIVTTKTSQYVVGSDSAVIIPQGVHHCVGGTDGIKWYAFLTSSNAKEMTQKKFPSEFLADFVKKLDSNSNGENCNSIVNHIRFIYNELTDTCVYSNIPNGDYIEEIFSFITNHYNKNLRVSDIADALHISETHAQRIIKKHTGKSFGELLLQQRMLIADALVKRNEMPLKKIAETVGYNSYSGFWKAYFKYKEDDTKIIATSKKTHL